MLLEHAFEMLLKSIIFEKTGRIRAPKEKLNYGFDKCLDICQSRLNVLDSDEALILRNLNGFRDAAAHDLLDIGEGLLYSHVQSAVNIFTSLLKKVFRQNLAAILPKRVLPITAAVPQDIQALVSSDLEEVKALLSGKRRREDEAEARLRPYEVMEKNLRLVQGSESRTPSIRQIVRKMKKGSGRTVLPMVGMLVQGAPGGIPISIHLTKGKGFPVRIDQNAPDTIAFRYIKPEDKYPHLTGELADKVGVGRGKVVGLIKMFGFKGNDEYHMTMRIGKTTHVHRYSEKAFVVLRNAVAAEGLDTLWKIARAGQHKDPSQYKNDIEPLEMEVKEGNKIPA